MKGCFALPKIVADYNSINFFCDKHILTIWVELLKGHILATVILLLTFSSISTTQIECEKSSGLITQSIGFEYVYPKETQLGTDILVKIHLFARFGEVKVERLEVVFSYSNGETLHREQLLATAKLDTKGIDKTLLIKPPHEGQIIVDFYSTTEEGVDKKSGPWMFSHIKSPPTIEIFKAPALALKILTLGTLIGIIIGVGLMRLKHVRR